MEATSNREQTIRRVVDQRQAGLTLVLEDLHDPHNAAAIFRTCDAFGVQNIHLVFERERPWKPSQIGTSSSSSANKWLDFTVHESAEAALSTLATDGYRQVGAAISDNAVSIFDANLSGSRLAVWVGNEHRGLSAQALAGADQVVEIPMRGFVQSLNVSVSAALVLYEMTRQRRVTHQDIAESPTTRNQLLRSLWKKS